MQKESRDFEKKYALTVRSNISRILLRISASLEYKICQFDIIITFFNSKMVKHIYTTQPKEFEQRN